MPWIGHARIKKFLPEGSNSGKFFLLFFFFFFFVFVFFFWDEGSKNQNNTKSRPSSARQRNAISMADDGPTLNAGLVDL